MNSASASESGSDPPIGLNRKGLLTRKVKFVAYRLKRGVSIWWDRLREMRMREGCGPVQTWHKAKQLFVVDFCLRTMNKIFFLCLSEMYIG